MKTVKKGLLAASSLAVLLALGACGDRDTAMEQRAEDTTRTEQQASTPATQDSSASTSVMGAPSTTDQSVGMVDDAQIVTKVKSQLAADDEIRALAIDVDAQNGKVTLSGTVPSEDAKQRAEQIVKNTGDVKDVENKLEVRS